MLRAMSVVLAVAAVGLLTFVPARAEDVTFTFVPPEGSVYESVSLRGTFNDWTETPMEPAPGGTWSVTIDLSPGEYHYKYFLNGEWPGNMETDLGGQPVDPEAHDYIPDGYGGQNAVRTVGIWRHAGVSRRYGYRVDGDEIVFELDLTDCGAVTTTDGASVDLADITVGTVAVAGEFNRWSPTAWPMNAVEPGVFELRRPKADFDGSSHWLFKFVADEQDWIEPPRKATNLSPVAESTMSSNLILYVSDGLILLERLTLPESKRGDQCRLKPHSHAVGAPIVPMSFNPMVTEDRDMIGLLMTFVLPPSPEEMAAYEEQMKNVPPEQTDERAREIMKERAAGVSAAYAAVYEGAAGGPETGVYALLLEEPVSEEQKTALEQEGPTGFNMLRGSVALMAWADGSDRSCLETLRAHIESVLPE